jgi:type-F conjugative transfer system protein TrbI
MRLIYLMAGIALVALLAGFGFYGVKQEPNIALFDAEKLRGQLIYQLAEIKATEAQVAVAARKFNAVLPILLREYAKRHRVVIVERRSVLAGGGDITEAIARELSDVMRRAS